MSTADNTKLSRLSATAMNLFLKFGFKRVSVEEICQTSGVSKMTFYKHYKNKTDLLITLLNQIVENQMRRYQNIMNSDIPYSEKVMEIIRMKQDQAQMMGQELFNDLYRNAPPEITRILHELGTKHLSAVRDDFIRAQQEGHIRRDIQPDFILYFMDKMIDLASDEKLLRLYESSAELINEMTRFFFFGILAESEKVAS
jgi:AcrR family transcriptional regulator